MLRSSGNFRDGLSNFTRLFYFLYFAAAASLIPFLALHYQQLGFSGWQIGLLTGLLPLTTLIGASIWTGLADLTQQHHRLVLVAIGGAWIAALLLSTVELFIVLIPVIIIYAFFVAPIMPMADSTVMHLLGNRKSEYGRIRLWGAVGWGLAAPVAGILINRSGTQWAFYLYLIIMFGMFLVSVRMPFSGAELGGRFRQGLRTLLSNYQWLLFLFVVLLEGMAFSITLNFLFLYMEDLGISALLMGLTLTFATVSELPVWRYSERWLVRWGTRSLMIFSLVVLIVRTFAYSLVTTGWLFLLISLLHGPSYSSMWSAGVTYANETAPAGLGATAQGIFSGTVVGLGAGLGAFLGGLLFDSVGPEWMFRLVGLGLMAALVLYLIAGRESVRLKPAPVET